MMISNLYSITFETTPNFQINLDKFLALTKETKENSLILAPEVSLSGFCYDKMDLASEFSIYAIEQIMKFSTNRIIGISFIEKRDYKFFNSFKLISNSKIIYSQDKFKLFPLGNEEKYFASGYDSFKIIQIGDIKVAVLICFEIRFSHLWTKVRGADVILVPAFWGVERREHLKTLTKALAIINQCYVIVANSSNSDMANESGVISPFGEEIRDNSKSLIYSPLFPKEIERVRRYIKVDF